MTVQTLQIYNKTTVQTADRRLREAFLHCCRDGAFNRLSVRLQSAIFVIGATLYVQSRGFPLLFR
ncbi:hypothetical protein X989_5722 [Burkholderia pseudomallei MSHR4378]|nr:araC family regulatory domain protein [Burkholderia pseudomallei]KGS16864.1 hypothetical protein X989_5722 [Burkholderia pseudomallei MSHR4378]